MKGFDMINVKQMGFIVFLMNLITKNIRPRIDFEAPGTSRWQTARLFKACSFLKEKNK